MRKVTCLIQLLFAIQGFAQTQVSLQQCQELAIKNHPWTSQEGYYKELEQLNSKSINTAWYPTITLAGQATWQSDVTTLELNLPANSPIQIDQPKHRHDQYKTTLEIKQTIYDGGLTKGRKLIEQADLEVSTQAATVEIVKVKDLINKMYFAALVNDKLVEQMTISLETLKQRRLVVESTIRNGVALQSDLDAFDAEIISIEQKIEDLRMTRESALVNLAKLTGDTSISIKTQIAQPSVDWQPADTIKRQELALFDVQVKRVDASSKVIGAGNRPRAFAFSTLGYGNPGLNMFKEGWQPYALVGIGFSWVLTDWGKTSRDKRVLGFQKQIIDSKRVDFVRNVNVAMESQQTEIEKLQVQLATDKKLIDLRERITRTTASQQTAGTATSLDYITQFNKERDARIAMEVHKVLLQKAVADYKYLAGE